MPMTDRRRRITAFVVAMAVLIATPLVVVATDAFTDVPASNVHHDDITWLRDADVTRGCNPPANDRFCPGDPVLRQQMASFMRRLAENQVVDAATAITAESAANAEQLNGITMDRFFHQVPIGTTDSEIGSFGPVTLYATCDAGNVPTLRASWSETVNHLTFQGSSASLFGNATVNAGQTIDIGSGQFGDVGRAEAVAFESKTHTSVEYFLRRSPALGDAMCFFSGYVTVG